MTRSKLTIINMPKVLGETSSSLNRKKDAIARTIAAGIAKNGSITIGSHPQDYPKKCMRGSKRILGKLPYIQE